MLLVAVAISVTSSTRSFLIRCKGLSRLVCPVLRLRLQVRRESLLQHFVDQAAELQPHQLPVHILSDIDMTVWVGTFGAGGARAERDCTPRLFTPRRWTEVSGGSHPRRSSALHRFGWPRDLPFGKTTDLGKPDQASTGEAGSRQQGGLRRTQALL